MGLQDLVGLSMKKVRALHIGKSYPGDMVACLIRLVRCDYRGIKKNTFAIQNEDTAYLSGLFVTTNHPVFSADYKDDLGMKDLVTVRVTDSGEVTVISL